MNNVDLEKFSNRRVIFVVEGDLQLKAAGSD